MKRKFKYILFLSVWCILFQNACNSDFLDLPPYTSIPADEALLTEVDALSAVNGSYAGLRSFHLYGRTIPLMGDLWADNVLISSRNAGRYTEIFNNNFVENNQWFTGLWQNAYRVINRVNNIIAATPSGDEENINQYKGEAYAIRALLYFELVRFFARPYTDDPNGLGVPLVLTFDIDARPTRASVADIYNQILSDLEQAYNLMNQTTNSGRFSKYAARALAAKVNLHRGTQESYQLAFDYAHEVIDNSGVNLVTIANYGAYWQAVGSQTLGNETLLEIVSDQIDNGGFDELPYFFNQQGYGDGLAQRALYDSYSETDVRKNLVLVGTRSNAENPAYIVNKYPDLVNYGTKKILRISDVYLIAAEAAYRMQQEARAVTYLMSLISQRDPAAEVTETGAELFERIITERRKELAFEGDRYHTLNRLQRDITGRTPSQAVTIPYSDFRRVAPIPLTELDRNSNLVQNEGWSN
ncbi:RagB/SusD family nutrient uptake outer membrane protein [Sphingobacterium paludis]|uniref:SusD-like starch-binding protein associating with outer membrane n=1 Tax=Sphingobacterium paludis TaxID=1476465 RepID=A0A4R7D2X6_9SPHI|nr:RagB/SusD family nutrient uptake outer membrane protein [Sphingobacterium paludis]TDS13965.1 SusD-like starch-binding protein associating with outer membrane [Sphingobacterium paludis]